MRRAGGAQVGAGVGASLRARSARTATVAKVTHITESTATAIFQPRATVCPAGFGATNELEKLGGTDGSAEIDGSEETDGWDEPEDAAVSRVAGSSSRT